MQECIVCLEDVVDFVTLPCAHQLCVLCYSKVINAAAKCPLCETEMGLVTCPLTETDKKTTLFTARPRPGAYDDPCCRYLVVSFGCSMMFFMVFVMSQKMFNLH